MGERSVVGEDGEERQQWRRGSGKKKRRISTNEDEGRNGGRGWEDERTATNEKGEGEEKEAEAEAGNLDRIDHLLKPRVLVAADRPSTPFAKIWILLDLRVELKVR